MSRSTEKIQFLFSTGEVTPKLAGRTDVEKVSGGCRTLQNMVVAPQGFAARRAGTEFIAVARGTALPTVPSPSGEPLTVPLFHGYHYFDGTVLDDNSAYEVMFGGNVSLYADGRVHFVGSIRASNRGLGGPEINVPYQVLVNGALVTIQSADTDFSPVAVNVLLAAGSLSTLRFPAGYIIDGVELPQWDLNLLAYPQGSLFNSGFDLPEDPDSVSNGHAVSLSVSGTTLIMDGRYADNSGPAEQAALHSYAISNLGNATRTAQLIHLQTLISSGSQAYTFTRNIGSNDLLVFLARGQTGGPSFQEGMYLGPFAP